MRSLSNESLRFPCLLLHPPPPPTPASQFPSSHAVLFRGKLSTEPVSVERKRGAKATTPVIRPRASRRLGLRCRRRWRNRRHFRFDLHLLLHLLRRHPQHRRQRPPLSSVYFLRSPSCCCCCCCCGCCCC